MDNMQRFGHSAGRRKRFADVERAISKYMCSTTPERSDFMENADSGNSVRVYRANGEGAVFRIDAVRLTTIGKLIASQDHYLADATQRKINHPKPQPVLQF